MGILLLQSPAVLAQKVLTLEECIAIALENNLDLKLAENDVLMARSNESQSAVNFLPSLYAGINYDLVHGASFDQANGRISSTRKSSSPGLYAEATIFNGLENHNQLKRDQILTEAALKNVQSTKDQVKLIVLDLYLQVLIDQEEINITQERLGLLDEQLVKAQKRVDAGVENMQEVYNLNSQIANEKLSLVNIGNKLKSDKLTLLQALQIDAATDYDVAPLEMEEAEMRLAPGNYNLILQKALDRSPALDNAQLLVEAAKKDINIAKARSMPQLSISGALTSRYSSNGAFDPEQNRIVNMSYLDQLDLNRSEYVSLNLTIPIFNKRLVKKSVQLSEINASNSELAYLKTRMNLVNNVQQAYHDLLSAQSAYQAARENLAALTQAFRFAETSYNSGNSDFYSYVESLKNKNRAEFNLKIFRYSFFLRKKILDVYMSEADGNSNGLLFEN